MKGYPDWVILHIPHDSMLIPADVRQQFLLTDKEIAEELWRMTDHDTRALFTSGIELHIAYSPVSRLVVDVERFEDDAQESMSARGMGAIYMKTSQGEPLRRELSAGVRTALLDAYYRPHHAHLSAMVSDCIDRHGRCLVIDCHSFPHRPLPYEPVQDLIRPDICIGTDGYHTPEGLKTAFVESFTEDGLKVSINTPFSGSLVPIDRYGSDKRVSSIMVEVNRSLYFDEISNRRHDDFVEMAARITGLCLKAVERWISVG